MSNGPWAREGSLEGSLSKHRLDEPEKDSMKKDDTPKRLKVEHMVDPSPESKIII